MSAILGVSARMTPATTQQGTRPETQMTTMTITSHTTGETLTLSRDVRTVHPAWVHEQMGTETEAELQAALDQYAGAEGLGPDADGVAVVRA